MGSLFSYASELVHYLSLILFRALQYLVSPHIGTLSDEVGRKPVLLLTMAGNILSALV